MSSVTINLSPNGNFLKKWDIIKIASTDDSSILIRKKTTDTVISATIYPYEKQDSRFAQWVWFKLLKLLVFVRLIK